MSFLGGVIGPDRGKGYTPPVKVRFEDRLAEILEGYADPDLAAYIINSFIDSGLLCEDCKQRITQ